MTPPIELQVVAFDPGAMVSGDGESVLSEATLWRSPDGRFLLSVEAEDGRTFEVALAADFLDEFLAHARTREAAA